MTVDNDPDIADRIAPLRIDAAQSPTLPGFYYHRPDIFEAEKDNIFFKTWQLVAHVSQIQEPGAFVTGRIIDQDVFVIRGEDGAIRGFYNVCQHRAHTLLEGTGTLKTRVICPYHQWTYSFSGDLSSVRYCKNPAFDKGELNLSPIRTQEVLGFVFVNLDPRAARLEDLPGNMFDDIAAQVPDLDAMVFEPSLSSASSPRATLHVNWKVLSENSLENYHVPAAHPAYAEMVDIDSYEWRMQGVWIRGRGQIKNLEAGAYAIDPSQSDRSAITWRLWPTTAFFLLPGEDSFSVIRYHPVSPDCTLRSNITLVRPGQKPRPDRWSYLWETIWEEDARICESVQHGLRSRGYRQGRFMINSDRPSVSEHGPHLFQVNYAKAMNLEVL